MAYVFKRISFSDQDIKQYANFLSSPFTLSSKYTNTNKVNRKYILWQYIENPLGHCVGYSAYNNDQIVSHFASLPVKYLVDGIPRIGLLALNLVTHPEHRGKGLFLEIVNRTTTDAIDEGYAFMIGVANQNSSHGLIRKLGFSLVSQLRIKIGFGSMIPEYDHSNRLKSIWTDETMKWRLSNPSLQYSFSWKNTIVAPTGKFKISAQLTSRNETEIMRGILERKSSALYVWIGMSNHSAAAGIFVNLPRKIRPVPLNLIYKNLGGINESFNEDDVLFELIDFDAY
jgi:GNAT superfamily N-acetyltransferase